ncbi:MAG: hemolysin family protein [Chloroflexi bacterium]|nr:hemolysin family protein [Chloroflexota bacterium]
MRVGTSLGMLALLGLVAFVLALGRSAMVNSHASRLRAFQNMGQRRAAWAMRVIEDASRLIVSLALAQNIARLLFLGAALAGFGGAFSLAWLAWSRWVGVLLASGVGLALLESLADSLGHRDPERWAMRLVPIIGPLVMVLAPLGLAFRRLGSAGLPAPASARSGLVTEEEIKTLVDAGEEGGAIEEEEKEMIFSIFQLSDTLAREVMVPRIDIVAFEAETTLDDATRTLIDTGHSRAPVFSGAIDHVVGLLYGKDILAAQHAGRTGRSVRDIMRPAIFVPEAKKVDDLLAEMQARRVQMVIVVDEYGGTAGLVTLEDIVEEIVGEIRDEYDGAEEMPYQVLPDGGFVLSGGIDLDDVNELTGSQLVKDANETLSGLIHSQLGRVAAAGDVLEVVGLRLKVEQVLGRRVRKVHAVRLELREATEAEEHDDHANPTG